ncbi:hypothetical protein D3Z46_08990 [Bacteroides sartorii]|nr:hypothetical protein [Phocaeicola sartorii]
MKKWKAPSFSPQIATMAYWMSLTNRKLDAKMPSCPHFCCNLFIMTCLLVVVAYSLVRALPSLTNAPK